MKTAEESSNSPALNIDKMSEFESIYRFRQELERAFGATSLNQDKLYNLLKSHDMDVEKALNVVFSNFLFFKKELTTVNNQNMFCWTENKWESPQVWELLNHK